MTVLGLVLVAFAVVLIVLDRRRWLLNLLAAASGLPIGVVFVGAGQAVSAVYAVALGLCAYQVWSFLTRRALPIGVRPTVEPVPGHRPGLHLLIFFALWSTLITLVGPTLFAGLPVLSPRGGLDEQVLNPVALAYSVSDIAQITYTLLGVSIIWFVAKSKLARPGHPGFGLSVATLLSFWRLLSFYTPIPFPEGLFDNNPTVRIIDTTDTGEPRFRGIYSEPSSMGAGALTAAVFFAVFQRQLTGWRRAYAIMVLGMALANGVMSRSATFVTSGALQLGLVAVVVVGGFLYRRSLIRPGVVALTLVGTAVAALFVPRAITLVQAVLSDKLGSTSYSSRSAADVFSLRLLLDTWGMGAGLGSNRPSSLLPSALSRVGIPGTVAFFGLIATMLRRSWPRKEYRATVWVFGCSVLTRLVSGPGLLEPFMAICIGLLASDLWFRRTDGRDDNGGYRRGSASAVRPNGSGSNSPAATADSQPV